MRVIYHKSHFGDHCTESVNNARGRKKPEHGSNELKTRTQRANIHSYMCVCVCAYKNPSIMPPTLDRAPQPTSKPPAHKTAPSEHPGRAAAADDDGKRIVLTR